MKIKAYLNGMREFRIDFTTHYDEPEINAYDWGREWAHRLTLRMFEQEPNHYPWRRRITLRQGIGWH
jgi:hypothetical protein